MGGQPPQSDDIRGTSLSDEFPWELGIYDAHCHPTDTMASIDQIPNMKARAITIMATRSQDQDLVAAAASDQGLEPLEGQKEGHQTTQDQTQTNEPSKSTGKIVPSFGWHPWFSYQLYDDTLPPSEQTYDPEKATGDNHLPEKLRHLAAVLHPSPTDPSFAAALPPLTSLSSFIASTRSRLQTHPTAVVGEIGLDKAMRLPEPWSDAAPPPERDAGLTPGGREGRRLSPYHVKMPHQVGVLKAQLRLAGELGRAVSVHGVQAQGNLFEALAEGWKGHEREMLSRKQRRQIAEGAEDFEEGEDSDDDDDGGGGARQKPSQTAKPYPPRICLHSFSGSVEVVKQYLDPKIPAEIFFSFSTAVNLSTPAGENKTPEVIAACPGDRILVESDLHIAGDRMDSALEEMYRRVCEIKGWDLREGVERIGKNYQRFVGFSV